MFKKEISYVDFNGTERKEDLYFHLSLPELTRIEAEAGAELKPHIQKLVADNNTKDLLAFLEKVVLTAYGEKTPDGRSFRKNQQIREEFEYSPAYAEFFEMLLTEEGLAAEFGEHVAAKRKKQDNVVNPQIVSE